MKRYKMYFEYDGTHFFGWQKQPDVRTVEMEIETALSTLFQREIDITGQGRTDSGVHAEMQVAHADLPTDIETGKVVHALRGLLPEDVALTGIEEVHSEFHSRFDAISRSYLYRISTEPTPIFRHISWYHSTKLNGSALNECAEVILGNHNFIRFCIPSGDEYQTTDCDISESHWERESGFWVYRITGNRFLRHMVRRLVGTMAKVAAGRGTFSDFKKLIDQHEEEKLRVFTAPAQGLTLQKVLYNK